MKYLALIAAVGLTLLCLPGHAPAGCNHAYVRHYGIVKQVVAYQPVYYAIGPGIREEAIATRAAQIAVQANDAKWSKYVQERDAKLLQFRGRGTIEFGGEATADGQPADNGGQQPLPGNGGTTPDEVAKVFVAANCVQCHGPTPRGNNLDLTAGVDFRTMKEVVSRTMSATEGYRMPPTGDPLTDAQIGVLFKHSESLRPTQRNQE